MGSFTQLNKQDIFVLPYNANKQWDLAYDCLPQEDSYFNVYRGKKLTSTVFSPGDIINEPITNGKYERLVYNQINHLFYQSYSGSLLDTSSLMSTVDNYQSASTQRPTSSYDVSLNSDIIKHFPSASNSLITVLEIKQNIFGNQILPYTFNLSSSVYNITDDGKGNLYDDSIHVGNIFYSNGIAVLTNSDYQNLFPLPPLAGDYIFSFFPTESKIMDVLSSVAVRTGNLNIGSVNIFDEDYEFFTNNLDGTITLNSGLTGTYTTYYTVTSTYGNGCILTSNIGKITVIINEEIVPIPATTTTTTTTTTYSIYDCLLAGTAVVV